MSAVAKCSQQLTDDCLLVIILIVQLCFVFRVIGVMQCVERVRPRRLRLGLFYNVVSVQSCPQVRHVLSALSILLLPDSAINFGQSTKFNRATF